jgi:hypothetical protein
MEFITGSKKSQYHFQKKAQLLRFFFKAREFAKNKVSPNTPPNYNI